MRAWVGIAVSPEWKIEREGKGENSKKAYQVWVIRVGLAEGVSCLTHVWLRIVQHVLHEDNHVVDRSTTHVIMQRGSLVFCTCDSVLCSMSCTRTIMLLTAMSVTALLQIVSGSQDGWWRAACVAHATQYYVARPEQTSVGMSCYWHAWERTSYFRFGQDPIALRSPRIAYAGRPAFELFCQFVRAWGRTKIWHIWSMYLELKQAYVLTQTTNFCIQPSHNNVIYRWRFIAWFLMPPHMLLYIALPVPCKAINP